MKAGEKLPPRGSLGNKAKALGCTHRVASSALLLLLSVEVLVSKCVL